MAFEDFFTMYNMVKPPKGVRDNPNLKISEIKGQTYDPYLFDNFTAKPSSILNEEFPALESPFEVSSEDNYESDYETNQLNYSQQPVVDEFRQSLVVSQKLLSMDIEDLLKSEGITSVNGKPIKFGNKGLRDWGSEKSHHKKRDPHTGNANARDISIVGGTLKDYADFRNILLNNNTVREYMASKGWGIINEITPEILKQSKGTGPHFHFGPDRWAVDTWRAWQSNPTIDITKNLKS